MKKNKIFRVYGFMFSCLFFSLLATQWNGFSNALATKPPKDKVPAPLLKWPEKGADYAILVDKSLQKVFVYQKDNPFKPHRTYVCSTGENEGPKLREKDRKTPEGIYFFTRAYEKRELLPIYGSRAFALDYPNLIDRREGKNGHGIWFHGLNKPLKPKDTNGCVALENPDIDDLANFIRIEDTPVILSERIEMVDLSEMERERDEVIRIIETWRNSWESKDVDKYMSFYDSSFQSRGMDLKAWKKHREKLNQEYRSIRVEINEVNVEPASAVLATVRFTQRYEADNYADEGFKSLLLVKRGKDWKIRGEEWKPLDQESRP